MKKTRKKYTKRNPKNKRPNKLKHKSRKLLKHKSRKLLRHKGGSNGFVQLGYNTTRGITSTINNFINTYMGESRTPSPQATKSQYYKSR